MANTVELIIGARDQASPVIKGVRTEVDRLTSAKNAATTAANQWGSALSMLPGPLGGLASQAASVARLLAGPGGIVVGMGLAAAAGVGLVKSLADDIERLDNLSRQTGLAVSSLQAFEHAATQAGESPDTLVQGLGRINAAINDVLTGTAGAGKAFLAIGVDLQTLVKDGASTEQILDATAKALAEIPDPTQRAAAQMELFGTRGRAMSTVLDTIAQKGLPAYVAELKAAGVVTSDETNKMAREFDATWDSLEQRSKAFVIQLQSDILASIANIRKMWNLTKDIFADPALAGRVVQGEQVHEIVRPGIAPSPKRSLRRDSADGDLAAANRAATSTAEALLAAQGKVLDVITLQQSAVVVLAAKERQSALERIDALERIPGHAEEAAQRRLKADEDFFDKVVLAELEAAAKRKAAIDGWAASATAAFESLGPGFEKATQALTLSKFVDESKQSITVLEHLKKGLEAGNPEFTRLGLTVDQVSGGIGKLKENMQSAIQNGMAPAAKATGEAALSFEEYSKQLADGTKFLASFGAANDANLRQMFQYPEAIGKNIAAGQKFVTTFEKVGDSFVQTAADVAVFTKSTGTVGDEATKAADANMAVVTSLGSVDQATTRTVGSLDQLAQGYEKAAAAAKKLEDVQTVHSLDTSLAQIRVAMGFVSQDTAEYNARLAQAANGVQGMSIQVGGLTLSLLDLIRAQAQAKQSLLFQTAAGPLTINIAESIAKILESIKAAAAGQKVVDEFLERIFNPKKVGVLDPTQEATDALQRQAEQLRAQIRYNEAYGLSVEALTRQLAALELQIERVAAAEALRAFGGPTTLGVRRDVSPGGVQRSHLGTGNWSTGGGIQAAAGPPPGSSGTPGNAAGGISITINAAPGQSPQDIAKAVVPAIRRATQRGTV